ncbi:MAG: DUF927 domain-containing protein [Methylophilaceae bacterium]
MESKTLQAFDDDMQAATSDYSSAVDTNIPGSAESLEERAMNLQGNKKTGVTEVTRVQASDSKGFSSYPDENAEVTGVQVPALKDRPCFKVFDEVFNHGGIKYPSGVWFFGTDKEGEPTQTRIASPIHVDAITFDGHENNFGRLLRFKNSLGNWRKWAMPMELMRGSADELRGELLNMGVEIDPTAKARNLLSSFLQDRPPKLRIHCALQIGWCEGSFVLPDVVIGAKEKEIIFQSGERGNNEYSTGGDLAGWRSNIAAMATGNPILMLALSSSFAAPLLAKCNMDGGGVHLIGNSSTGKSSATDAACSVWGGANYRRSWRTTSNGLEGAAVMFNDCLLALDEISQCDPKEVGAIVYALGNGTGKQRAGRSGNARAVAHWRCFVLSNGERSVSTSMAEGGIKAKAGQSVRIIDLPVFGQHGAWNDLHGHANGADFSDAINKAAKVHHGIAGREFLKRLTADSANFTELLEAINGQPEFTADDGQAKRVARRFALIALAGELGTKYGITGWKAGDATNAAAECFKVWQSMRGTGTHERRQVLELVQGFIDKHGSGRFSDASASDAAIVHNRAGWWRHSTNGREYLFTADGMKDALTGHDLRPSLTVLREAGAVIPHTDGKSQTPIRINGNLTKLYVVDYSKLGANDGNG